MIVGPGEGEVLPTRDILDMLGDGADLADGLNVQILLSVHCSLLLAGFIFFLLGRRRNLLFSGRFNNIYCFLLDSSLIPLFRFLSLLSLIGYLCLFDLCLDGSIIIDFNTTNCTDSLLSGVRPIFIRLLII